VGRQAQPSPRQRRLEARLLRASRNGHSIRPAHYRLVCVGSQHAIAPVQRKLARPVVRTSGLPSPRRFDLARGKQLMQPAMALATRPRPKTAAERRSSHSGRPPLARQSVAPGPYRVGVPRDGLAGPRALVPSRAAARTRYSRQASRARHCLPDSLPAWLYLRRGAVSATLTMFNTRQIGQAVQVYPTRASKSATR
jgi:hypothetical protein